MVEEKVVTTEQQCRLAGGERIAILYFTSRKGFEPRSAHFEVVRFRGGERMSADPRRSYAQRDRTTFFIEQSDPFGKTEALNLAQNWVWKVYQKSGFVQNAFGDYVEKVVEFLHPTK